MEFAFNLSAAATSSVRLASPPRQLSPALRDWATRYGAVRVRWWVLAIVGIANMLGGVLLITAYFVGQNGRAEAQAQFEESRQNLDQLLAEDLTAEARARVLAARRKLEADASPESSRGTGPLWGGIAWIGLDVGLLSGIVLFMRARGARRGRQLLSLLESGSVGHAQVLANKVDYSIQVNGAPRRSVTLAIDGRERQIKTYDHNYANLFPEGAVIEVLYNDRASDLVFPVFAVPAL